jgi:hypothetical protein
MSPHGPSGTIHRRMTLASLVSRTVGHFVAWKIEQLGQFPRECSLPTTGGANHIDALETADLFEIHSPQKNAIAHYRTTCASAAGDHPTARTNQGFRCSASARGDVRAELRPTSACRLHARVRRRDDFTASAWRPSHPAYLERCMFSLAAWRSPFSLWLPLRPFAHSFERLLSACWWPLLSLSSSSGLPAALKELHRAFMLLGGCPGVKRS